MHPCRTPDTDPIPDPDSRIPNPGSWTSSPGSWSPSSLCFCYTVYSLLLFRLFSSGFFFVSVVRSVQVPCVFLLFRLFVAVRFFRCFGYSYGFVFLLFRLLFRVLYPKSRIPGTRSWTPDPGTRIPDTEAGIDSGFWI